MQVNKRARDVSARALGDQLGCTTLKNMSCTGNRY